MKYRVKVKFNFFNQGDIVGDAEYNKYGAQYFEPVSEKPIDSANTADIPAPPHDTVMSSADVMTKAKAEEEAKAKAEAKPKTKAPK